MKNVLQYLLLTYNFIFVQLSNRILLAEKEQIENDIKHRRSTFDYFLKSEKKYESCENRRHEKMITTVSERKELSTSNKRTINEEGKLNNEEIVDKETIGHKELSFQSLNANTKKDAKTDSKKIDTKEYSEIRIQLPKLDKIELGKNVEVTLPGDIDSNVKVLSVSPLVIEVSNFIDDEECELFLTLARAKQPKPIKQELDKFKLKTAKQTFGEWDYNEDGYITRDEMVLLPGLADVSLSIEDIDDMLFMLKMDKNNDKKIDLEELKTTDFTKLKRYIDTLKSQEGKKRDLESRGAWVWHDDDELLRFKEYGYFEQFHERISAITDIPSEIIKESEPIKVKHFTEGQFQIIQQDSQPVRQHVPCCMYGDRNECRNCRYLSYTIFLNDVEEGGELVFPMANHRFQDIMANSGNWRGYYVYSKTTGHKYYFQVELQFTKEGVNRIFSGEGNEDSTQFSFINGLIIGDQISFDKTYSNGDKNFIKYTGKVIEHTKIEGNWWVPGNKRYRGTFYMWNREYELYSNRAIDESNRKETCPKSALVIRPSKGKAIFWYNHHIDSRTGMMGELHQEALTAHCEVIKGSKWIASSWINIIGDGDLELKAWRRGFNLLHVKKNIYDMLGTNEQKLTYEVYKEEFMADIEEKNNTLSEIPGYYKHKLPSSASQALKILFNEMTPEQLKLIASTVEKKLGLQCVPLVTKHKGKIHVIDGTTE